MDTDRQDEPGQDEPVDLDLGTTTTHVSEPLAAEAPRTRLPLGILAGLGVALAGVAAWSLLYALAGRDYVGISVVFGLLIGYVVREVSRRTDLLPRVAAAVLAAALCVVGSTAALAANTAHEFHQPFTRILGDLLPHTFEILKDRNVLTFAIFAAAVVVAFVSAAEPKPKKAKAGPPPGYEPPADEQSE
jgi:hypothetical protein